jgi:hypothetical protein
MTKKSDEGGYDPSRKPYTEEEVLGRLYFVRDTSLDNWVSIVSGYIPDHLKENIYQAQADYSRAVGERVRMVGKKTHGSIEIKIEGLDPSQIKVNGDE